MNEMIYMKCIIYCTAGMKSNELRGNMVSFDFTPAVQYMMHFIYIISFINSLITGTCEPRNSLHLDYSVPGLVVANKKKTSKSSPWTGFEPGAPTLKELFLST